MSTLFMIGNGFDLNCGMKTRYKDVYEGYVKTASPTENIRRFKESIVGDIENWGDFEMAMAQYAGRFVKESDLLECVRDFARYMEQYLIEEMVVFKKKLHDDSMLEVVTYEMQRSFGTFYQGISHNIDTEMGRRVAWNIRGITVLSFNYTDVFDLLLNQYSESIAKAMPALIHIHGVLGDGPVIGVDHAEQIRGYDKLSRKGMRGFVKPVFNEEYDSKRVKDAKQMIQNADTICVYGMSLGESDLTWRNELIAWLGQSTIHHLFIYQYSLSKKTYTTISEKLDMEDDAKEALFHEWGIEARESIYGQVHIPCGKNIFNIYEAIEEAKKKTGVA